MKPILIPLFLLATLVASPSATAAAKPVKVFILAGQSNMQGHAKVSTFEHIGMDPATKPMLAEMLDADGKPRVCERVWISSIGCAEAEQTGKLTAGFVWFQGWNDMVDSGTYPNRDKPGGYDAYSTAMAHLPEFKGTVAAVRTEKYWDQELTAAKTKDNEIKQRAKKLATEGKLKPAEEKAALEKMRAEGLTERERLVLEKGISNLEFHYLGSAKILGGIGKGLAEAMAELKQLTQLTQFKKQS